MDLDGFSDYIFEDIFKNVDSHQSLIDLANTNTNFLRHAARRLEALPGQIPLRLFLKSQEEAQNDRRISFDEFANEDFVEVFGQEECI